MTAVKVKMRVRNFQAIADARLEIEGLTVVTGKSNTGKTALIRAASAMLFGNPGEYYIKRGEDWTGGAILMDGGTQPLKIIWRKVAQGKKKPNLQTVLEVNGQQLTKIGREHKALTAPYGIAEIETAATRLRPQIAMQHDPIFLVAENETTAAEVFKLLGRVDIITEAQRLAKRDLKDADSKKKIRAQDQVTVRSRRDELAHVPQLRMEVNQLRADTEALTQRADKLTRNKALIEELKALEPREIPTPPEEPARPVQDILAALLRDLKALSPREIPAPPIIPVWEASNSLPLLRELKGLDQDLENLKQAKDWNLMEQGKMEAQKLELEKELGICPTCQRAFADHDENH